MSRADASTLPVRDRILAKSLEIIERAGVEQLSLRAVAREIGVSHQAPYKHFPSRDHIVAELVAQAYGAFTTALDKATQGLAEHDRLTAMGIAYLDYAARHPLPYRLMFETPLPAPDVHPAMLEKARDAFEMLTGALSDLPERKSATTDQIHAEAQFIWSTLHGAASLSRSSALDTLDLSETVRRGHIQHTLEGLSRALNLPPPNAV